MFYPWGSTSISTDLLTHNIIPFLSYGACPRGSSFKCNSTQRSTSSGYTFEMTSDAFGSAMSTTGGVHMFSVCLESLSRKYLASP